MSISAITTHVLDTSTGRPASGIPVMLSFQKGNEWQEIGKSVTNTDGRAADLLPNDEKLTAGVYRLTFETGVYFRANGVTSFYPSVPVLFEIVDPTQHYHVPLLLNPYGYSTYRGS